jgi:NifB/MoaA-like Fe-S oxidoreductase
MGIGFANRGWVADRKQKRGAEKEKEKKKKKTNRPCTVCFPRLLSIKSN